MKRICLRISILHLALLFCFSGPVFASQMGSLQAEPSEPGQKQITATPNSDLEVINIVMDRMEDGYIYSNDGRAYRIGSAKLLNNASTTSKIKTAELTFQNGTLVVIVFK